MDSQFCQPPVSPAAPLRQSTPPSSNAGFPATCGARLVSGSSKPLRRTILFLASLVSNTPMLSRGVLLCCDSPAFFQRESAILRYLRIVYLRIQAVNNRFSTDSTHEWPRRAGRHSPDSWKEGGAMVFSDFLVRLRQSGIVCSPWQVRYAAAMGKLGPIMIDGSGNRRFDELHVLRMAEYLHTPRRRGRPPKIHRQLVTV